MISMTPRKDISLQRTLITPLVSILLTLCVGATIFGTLGYDPIVSLYQFFISPFVNFIRLDILNSVLSGHMP